MSGKKQKPSTWTICGKCGSKILRLTTGKHEDLNCGPVYPYFSGNSLYSKIVRLPASSSKLFFALKRFFSDEF